MKQTDRQTGGGRTEMYTIAKEGVGRCVHITIKNRIFDCSPAMIEIGANGVVLMALVTC